MIYRAFGPLAVRDTSINQTGLTLVRDVQRLFQLLEHLSLVCRGLLWLRLDMVVFQGRLEVHDVLSGCRVLLPLSVCVLLASTERMLLLACKGAIEANTVGVAPRRRKANDLGAERFVLALMSQHFTWTFAPDLVPRPRGGRTRLRFLTLPIIVLWTQKQLHAYLAHLLLVRHVSRRHSLGLGPWLLRSKGWRRPDEGSAVLL